MVATFHLPDAGEGTTEAEVVRWLVAEGDEVGINQPLVEIETVKAVVELPSPYAGRVLRLHAGVGDVLAVGAPLIDIGEDSPGPEPDPAAGVAGPGRTPVLVGYGVAPEGTRRRRRPTPSPSGAEHVEQGPPGEPVKPVRHGGLEVGRAAESRLAAEGAGRPRAKPPVRRLARELGVPLAAVEATGVDGLVTRADVLRAAQALATPTAATPHSIPVRGVTRTMAAAMVRSVQTVPQVTEWVQTDATEGLHTLRALVRAEAVPSAAATPLLLAAAGLLRAVARHPIINGRWDEVAGTIEVPAEVNLGIAVASPRGLVVPNLKGAQRLSLPDLAASLHQLVTAARQGRATPADLTGGTITITNVGVFGVDGGTPIINPPEAAILCLGQVARRPWVVADAVVPRDVVELTLSFDHRFIDGATGSAVLTDVAEYLTNPGLAALLDAARPAPPAPE